MPYELFTLNHEIEKSDPEYYKTMLKKFNLQTNDVICFEHNKSAVANARKAEINTFYYDYEKKDLKALEQFINKNL